MDKIIVLILSFFVFFLGCSDESKKEIHQGYSVMKYSDGTKYEGYWVNNKKHGKGVFTYKNGARYEGNFENDMKSGAGKFYWPGGDRFEGTFKDDDFYEGKLFFYDGKVCSGRFSRGVLNGKGRCVDKKGEIIEGAFSNGKLNGEGKIISYNKNLVMTGTFKNNHLNGTGSLLIKDVGEIKGVWEDGSFVKPVDNKSFKENNFKINFWRKKSIIKLIKEDMVGNGYKVDYDQENGDMTATSENKKQKVTAVYDKNGLRKTKMVELLKSSQKSEYIWVPKNCRYKKIFPWFCEGTWKSK